MPTCSSRTQAPTVHAVLAGAAFLLLSACAPAPRVAPSSAPGAATMPRDIHWVRNSAEYRAITIELYRLAEERVREAASTRSGSWAVVLDADETVLDNSEYQRRLADAGESYSSATWYAWAREERAGVVPGARSFLETVASLGGRIAIVTNRDEAICEPTRRNLDRLRVPWDVVLCRTDGQSDKDPRFEAVATGTADPDLPPLEIILWMGDNIGDFPGLDQEIRLQGGDAFEPFGERYIVIPNPMYGSWEGNAQE